ncbi:MAG: hypothetical protein CO094_01705 [Anaerolineae bacterium CG_4_9_14_3_um_filter_57_17]|nr:hypothetical protein [bacterium]NCT19957.1 hypothetical protein [bacterium]OIO84039.1 MAG: hypothetical protein AUK01_11225 [Anaerolineae bacterium CG2_30_57_67]PJB68292.1 MAG: hypothetical protein CO094_01705 [Anaerolineae bacterium CG_4_9_14_3_um_filter_57_17]
MIKRLLPTLFGFLLALLLLLIVLRQASPLTVFPSLDSGYYLYTGQQLLRGKIPYVDFWESKPPGIFYLNALGLLMGHGTRWGVWTLEFVFLALAAGLGFDVMRRRWGGLPAWLATFTWLIGLNAVLDGGNLTEEYALPLAFIAFWAFLRGQENSAARRYPFLLGLAFAGGFLLRANNTASALAGVLTWGLLALQTRDFRTLARRLLWSGLAVLLTVGGVALAFALGGNFRALLEAALLFNFSIQKESQGIAPVFLGGLAQIGIPAGFGLLGLAALAFSPARREPFSIFLFIALPLEIAFSAISGRGYAHYLMLWLPPLGLFSAALFATLPGLSRPPRAWLLPALFVAGLALAPQTISDYRQITQRLLFERQQGIEIGHPVAAYLREKTAPADFVLVWGGRLAFNFLARRETPSAILFYPLLADSSLSDGLAQRFYADLVSHPPALIVDTCAVNQDLLPCLDPAVRREQEKNGQLWPFLPDNLARVYKFVQANYALETTLGDYRLYRKITPSQKP